ncbi:glycosyltransferase, group 2 family protein [Turicibacter sp. HGF1]|uniref:glycosyltransferase family 2 protein n=1 Tax=Turicibacter sp. HGF1 TaxID=910310 RepID=UPI0001FD88E7|nr:glycosyltransferase family 2 protein [Turicibacter sp. HGF1]EGC90838.1 glycosyltransferase, group 2 family protein [Turicibacter sp. HGF1]
MGSQLVTIVVPIYNVENYLERCLESIVNQTYKNLEIILVDDGSPDKCPRICDDWAKKDSRIKVIHKTNAGLGMARNSGIDNATGEYICFFDSDDYVERNTIELALRSAIKYDSDIVIFGMNLVDQDKNIYQTIIPNTDKEYFKGDEIKNFIVPNMLSYDPVSGKKLDFNMSSSGRLYKMKLINENNWRYVSEREFISEDFYSLFVLHQYVKSVSIVKKAFYNYCFNECSLSHSFNPERFEKICYCYQGMVDIYDKSIYPNSVKLCLDSQFIGSVIGALKLIVNSNDSFYKKIREFKKIVNNDFLHKMITSMNYSKETLQRKTIIRSIKYKITLIVYLLVYLKRK